MAEVRSTAEGEKRLVIDPMENIIIGSNNIMQYLGIQSINTLYQWVELYGLPAIKRPDGMWMTSISSIDQWIFLAAEADLENRPNSRGYSQKLEIAKARLERRIEATKNETKRPVGPIAIPGSREGFDAATKDHPERLKRAAKTAKRNEEHAARKAEGA